MISRVLLTGCLLVCGLAQAQYPWDQNRPCGTTNGRGNPCVYSVPPDWEAKLLRENPQCTQVNPGHVTCSQPVRGSYGQFLMPAPRPGSLPITFAVPSTPPPLGVPPAQQAEADQLWQQANALYDRNRYRDAIPVLLKAANMGDRRAQATLGIAFQNGKGVKADDRAAAYWNIAAAAQGHRGAQYALGGMYEEGEGGLPKDLHKATELYMKSAAQGFDRAQIAMGIQYELGQEVPRSRPKALELLRASGDSDALWIAQLLGDRRTPARFADEHALDVFLGGVKNAIIAAAWARAHPNNGGGGAGMPPAMSADSYNLHQWKAGGEYGPRPGGTGFHSGPQ
jgi:Sel1 repeat